MITNTIRRYRHKQYRYAKKYLLPTRLQWLALVLAMLALLMVSYVFDAYRMKAEADERAAFISNTKGLFKGCVEGRNALGSKIMEDGKEWEERCVTFMRRKGT